MKLLIKSVLRHIGQRRWQTIFTFFITVLVVAMLSTIFHVASSFQVLLREYALESVGSYHYYYSTPDTSGTAILLRQMAEEFRTDNFFSAVDLEEKEKQVNLRLTVASPGLFTTKQMEERFEQSEAQFRAEYEKETPYVSILSRKHNFELLVSYGDLHKSNGMYSFLLVFLLIFSVITVAAFLTLGAVFHVSAVQRERDFGLFMSIGASGKQIKSMLFLESLVYIVLALPVGYLLGIVFFECSKNEIDNLLHALLDFPPIQLVISVPWSAVMLICAILIIFGSVWKPATRASKIHPIEALRQNKSIYVSNKERQKKATITEKRLFGIPGWLAWKNAKRFRKRYCPVLLVMTVAIVVCFVMTGFQQFTTEIAGMTYGGIENNISIQLSSDSLEALEEISERLVSESNGQLSPVREAIFLLAQSYPLSEIGKKSEILNSTSQMPDVMFFSVDEMTYNEICESIGREPNMEGKREGILITADRVWNKGGVTYQGVPFECSVGDIISVVQMGGVGQERKETEITVVGLWNEFPPYTATEVPVRLAMLVSESLMDILQPQGFSVMNGDGTYSVQLRGLVEHPEEIEQAVNRLLGQSSFVSGNVSNFSKELQQDIASISGFRYLMTALVSLLVLVCLCGNFIVTWTMGNARQKEFATFSSIGMTQKELRGMRWLEQALYSGGALLAGTILGMACYQSIYNVYSQVYQLEWRIPWKAFAMGVGILFVSGMLAELVMSEVSSRRSTTELLKMDEL